jgi:signal transduction histidine kinase
VSGSPKILFVDDDEGNLLVCEAHCSPEFDVCTARDAESALALLAEPDANIAVIVADQRMPGASGVELLERVHQAHPDVVRILITAYSDLSAAIAAINRGQVRRYLKKPWEPEELKAELRDAVEFYEMTRKVRAFDARLRETERVYALGIVAAGVGHELRNPITWLQGSVQMAEEQTRRIDSLVGKEGRSAAMHTALGKLRAALEQAGGAVDRVFDIVRGLTMPVSSNPPSTEIVDVRDVLKVTLRLVDGELKDAASVSTRLDGYPKVRGSATKVSQILLNLLVNAIHALSCRGAEKNRIQVRLREQAPWVVLEVADNGSGIPEEDRERVFDPFFTTKEAGGTGLGLAICRNIAQELGGSLVVAGDPELGGALFSLRLPSAM